MMLGPQTYRVYCNYCCHHLCQSSQCMAIGYLCIPPTRGARWCHYFYHIYVRCVKTTCCGDRNIV